MIDRDKQLRDAAYFFMLGIALIALVVGMTLGFVAGLLFLAVFFILVALIKVMAE